MAFVSGNTPFSHLSPMPGELLLIPEAHLGLMSSRIPESPFPMPPPQVAPQYLRYLSGFIRIFSL